MRGINSVFLMGTVGAEPEVKRTVSGKVVCDLRLATNRGVRGEEGWSEVADWHSIRLWEQQAELCTRYVHKGSVIAVEGTLRHDSWTDAHNNRRQVTYVVAERLHFVNLGNRKQSEAAGGQPESRPEGHPADPALADPVLSRPEAREESGDEAPF